MPRNQHYDHEAFPVLVLAAGASRRMGRPKALLPIAEGIMLDRAIDQGRHLGTRITVVTGGGYPLIRFRCQRSVSAWHYASGWSEGMAASLRSGIGSLGPRARGGFIVLLDQPLIIGDDLTHLATAARKAPAYIPRYLWPEIRLLEGDRGAASVLARHGAVTLPISGAFNDVDTPADWRRVSGCYQNRFAADGR